MRELQGKRAGRLQVDVDEMQQTIDDDNFECLGLANSPLKALATLLAYHRDPFDHY